MIPDWALWRARFEDYSARKTRAATTAALFPLVTRVERSEPRLQSIGNDWSRRLFDGPFYVAQPPHEPRPACSLVFVQSADGNTGADDPGALGGGQTDKHLIYEGLSRVAADGVMAGAGTVRGADIVFSVWHPEIVALRASLGLARHPTQIVVTNRGLDLDEGLMFNVAFVPVVLVTGPEIPSTIDDQIRKRPWIVRVPLNAGGWGDVFERLHAMGIRRVSCVGGRTLGRELLAGGLVNDVYLTTTPAPGGEPDTAIAPWPWRGRVVARKEGTGPDAGVVFEQVVPEARE